MISSKTHEIITFYAFEDCLEVFKNKYKYTKHQIEDIAVAKVKYVQGIDSPWYTELNYAWFFTCGYLPFSDMVTTSALPTIDLANYQEYVFHRSIYLCPNSRIDVIFDEEIHPICPNCGIRHENSPIPRLKDLWADFAYFATLKEIADDLGEVMRKSTALNYPKMRLKSEE